MTWGNTYFELTYSGTKLNDVIWIFLVVRLWHLGYSICVIFAGAYDRLAQTFLCMFNRIIMYETCVLIVMWLGQLALNTDQYVLAHTLKKWRNVWDFLGSIIRIHMNIISFSLHSLCKAYDKRRFFSLCTFAWIRFIWVVPWKLFKQISLWWSYISI